VPRRKGDEEKKERKVEERRKIKDGKTVIAKMEIME
jgi:hypothetical protein